MTYRMDYRGAGKMLTSPEMQAAMLVLAQKIKTRAVSIAPDAAPLGVGYIDAFEADSGVHKEKTRRAFGRVTNSSPHAKYVEFGGRAFGGKKTPKHRTLGKALDAVKE